MASVFRTPKAPLTMRSLLSCAAGPQSRGFSAVCRLPLARRRAALEIEAGA
ncbi:MAG: hypothetical protein M0026_08950 [Nocardiopsaceae bacterium]|nr:hypothetical protein [Nocardiopsaceae bacterium]